MDRLHRQQTNIEAFAKGIAPPRLDDDEFVLALADLIHNFKSTPTVTKVTSKNHELIASSKKISKVESRRQLLKRNQAQLRLLATVVLEKFFSKQRDDDE